MSFEEYVHHMTQKYRLAVAIAVLKGKPKELSIEQYLSKLREKLNNQMEIEDFDISICSNDFNFDDDETTLMINEFNESFNDGETSVENGANDSITILKDFDVNMASNVDENEFGETGSLPDVLRTLKSIDDGVTKKNNNTELMKTLTQSTYYEDSQTLLTPTPKMNDNHNITELSTTNNDSFGIKLNNLVANDVTGETQSLKIKDSEIVAKMAKNIHKTNLASDIPNKTDSNIQHSLHKHDSNSLFTKNTANIVHISAKTNRSCIQDDAKTVQDEDTIGFVHCNDKMVANVAKNVSKNPTKATDVQTNNYDSQATEIYTLHGFTQNCTHVSQSQLNNVEVAEHFLYNNRNLQKQYARNHTHLERDNMSQQEIINDDEVLETAVLNHNEEDNLNRNKRDVLPARTNIQTNDAQYFVDEKGQLYEILNTVNNNYNFHDSVEKPDKDNTTFVEIHSKNENFDIQHLNKPNTHNTDEVIVENIEDSEEETTSSQVELIPFKVVEEMNKIKMFLNKNVDRNSADGYSTDSGYRSDSQKSSYRIAPHTSSNWLNQSSHCLFNYIMESPLVATTSEIVKEISQILGKLIDRLHEEEKYPSFLENVLENIDTLIREVYEGDTCESVLLKKDERIQRLFLLNKSVHIQRYTIEKITCILENVHSYLTSQEELYELTNIEEAENICYIFHILEVILQRYIKAKHTSQATQPSQEEDRSLKKSSITDIWRKKWIPNYKECVKFEGSSQKTCVLEKCAGILNKIVVDCMEGYSLVAFAALQCFNLLQV